MPFPLNCSRCQSPLEMDDFSVTAMANIPQQQWSSFIVADKLDEVVMKYNAAMKKD
jgi:hypothetical protein